MWSNHNPALRLTVRGTTPYLLVFLQFRQALSAFFNFSNYGT